MEDKSVALHPPFLFKYGFGGVAQKYLVSFIGYRNPSVHFGSASVLQDIDDAPYLFLQKYISYLKNIEIFYGFKVERE